MFFEKLNYFFSKKAKLVTLCHHLGKAHVKGFVVVSRTVKVRVDDVRYSVVMVSRTVKVWVDDVRYSVVWPDSTPVSNGGSSAPMVCL